MEKKHSTLALGFSLLAAGLLTSCQEESAPDENRTAPPPPIETRFDSSLFQGDLTGIWRVRVEELSPLAPKYTLAKTAGLVYWTFSLADRGFQLREYRPQDHDSLSSDGVFAPSGFEPVAVDTAEFREAFLSFQIRGTADAFEHYELHRFEDGVIRGTYHVFDPRDGELESGPDYEGVLLLERVEETRSSSKRTPA